MYTPNNDGIKAYIDDSSGATAIEYVLIASALAFMLVPTTAVLSGRLLVFWQRMISWFE